MKPLTEQQAKNCEEAREPVCHCRCGGRAHGAKRGGGNASIGFYYTLPEDDPHYTPSPEKRKQLQQEKLAARRKERQDKIDAAQARVTQFLSAYYTAKRNDDYELAKQMHEKFVEAQQERDALYKTRV